ncbi:MAG: type II toxin-antitoxin system VapC family toxin [Alphaproteobacteria bacterium]|nr:type II toxin-antitoxin system VapC family toxin [Alphaproteobacteria bacterium]
MLAIDTNILIRYLVQDDPAQKGKARRLIENNEVFITTTVLLEAEWVLRSVYGFSPKQVAEAFAAFIGLPQVRPENPFLAAEALRLVDAGMDFADALHLTAAKDCEAFVSFDQQCLKVARAAGASVRSA